MRKLSGVDMMVIHDNDCNLKKNIKSEEGLLRMYHYLIDRDRIIDGLKVGMKGKHTSFNNKNSVGVLIKNFEGNILEFSDFFIKNCLKYNIPIGRIYLHRELEREVTSCPNNCFRIYDLHGALVNDLSVEFYRSEVEDHIIVERNFNMMNKKGRGHLFPYLYSSQSIFNNMRIFANFFYGYKGDIVYFGNSPLSNGNYYRGRFLFKINNMKDLTLKKICFMGDSTSVAKYNLEWTAEIYNFRI